MSFFSQLIHIFLLVFVGKSKIWTCKDQLSYSQSIILKLCIRLKIIFCLPVLKNVYSGTWSKGEKGLTRQQLVMNFTYISYPNLTRKHYIRWIWHVKCRVISLWSWRVWCGGLLHSLYFKFKPFEWNCAMNKINLN